MIHVKYYNFSYSGNPDIMPTGVMIRNRAILAWQRCGGKCDVIQETKECNRRCCPVNCQYTKWKVSKSGCRCDLGIHCPGFIQKKVCFRKRTKITEASCGGYCDDIIIEPICGLPCCYKPCVLGG